MTNRFRVSSTLLRRLEELGLSPDAVVQQAGLPMGLFNQEKSFRFAIGFFVLVLTLFLVFQERYTVLALKRKRRTGKLHSLRQAGLRGFPEFRRLRGCPVPRGFCETPQASRARAFVSPRPPRPYNSSGRCQHSFF